MKREQATYAENFQRKRLHPKFQSRLVLLLNFKDVVILNNCEGLRFPYCYFYAFKII